MQKLLTISLSLFLTSCETKTVPDASCLYAESKADVSAYALVHSAAACMRLDELKCDLYTYSPTITATHGSKQECEVVDGRSECFDVSHFNYNTSHLNTGDNSSAFEGGGKYNFAYYSCYVASTNGGPAELVAEDATISGAIAAARSQCDGGPK